MPAAWGRPPPPTQADTDVEELYASVGCALSHWEEIEGELSHWFALCIGKMWQHEAYDQYYEQGKTGRQRINTVQKAGEAYFVKHPSQEAEAKFSIVIDATREFANRRHELAHGVVRPIQWYWPVVQQFMKPPAGANFEYCLVPPHYQRSWFDPKDWNPEYVYTSKEIYEIDQAFVEHLHVLMHFRNDYLPEPPQRQTG